MGQNHWKSKDGITIPLWGTPERKEYENAFKDQLHRVFGGPQHTLRKLKIPVAQITESSGNMPVNKDRLSLYTRMARGGDRLPPIVVRRNRSDTFDLIDGSHRRAAAQAAGMKGIDAYELVPNTPAKPAVKKSLRKMAIADIKPGQDEGDHFTYSHVLHPDHVMAGYQLNVHPNVYHDGSHELVADLLHMGRSVGSLGGVLHNGVLKLDASKIDGPHRGKGLGLAMYEAMYAHARHGLGATHVEGDEHSTSAHGVHQKLARKHGLQYNAGPSEDANPAHGPTDFDGKFAPYKYALKSEAELEKMAIADIKPGSPEGRVHGRDPDVDAWNYTHVLPEPHHGTYRIQVQHVKGGWRARPEGRGETLVAKLFHKTSQGWRGAGSLEGVFHQGRKHLAVDYAAVHDAHQGKGLGLGLYEALYAHARNVLGATHVVGQEHSTLAAKAHQKLAQKHGLDYGAQQIGEQRGAFDDAFGPYQYALKAEKQLDRLIKNWKPPQIAPIVPPIVAPKANTPATPAPSPEKIAAPIVPGLQAPPAEMKAPLHSTVDGFMGQLKTLPKGGPERGKFITQHMNHGPFLAALKAHPQGATMHKQLTSYLNSASNAGFRAGGTKAVVKAEDARRLPPAEQSRLRKALRANKAKKLKKTANLHETSPATLDSRAEIAGHMLGFQPHMHHAFKAARFLVGGEPASLEQIRRALWDFDGDHIAAALHLYGIADTPASRKALEGHRDVEELDKAEGAGPQPAHALAVVPAAVRASKAISRAFENGTYQSVKLNGKHSSGSMLASDPETGLTFLLKPNAGGVSPAKGVGEETANQARREAAFWHASKLFGLQDYMPRADVVTIADTAGTTHEWAAILMLPPEWKPVEDWREADLNWVTRSLEKYRADGTLHQWGALDYILGNPDRHWGNALMHNADIKLIDQGSALAGKDFAPGSDKNSFVPFYLRYTCPSSKFNKLAVESKLRWMPTVSRDVDEMLRVWIHGVDPNVLAAVLRTYGVHPEACVERLKKLQSVEGSLSKWINRCWAAS